MEDQERKEPASEPEANVPEPKPTGGGGMAAKADLGKRAVALIIDCVVAGVVAMVLPILGGLIAAAYILLRDGFSFEFMDGRSLGKKLLKLRPTTEGGTPMDFGTSARRNWMFVLGYIGAAFLPIPILGWAIAVLASLAGLILGIVEIVLVITSDDGRRWGDKLAGTHVVEVTD